MFCPICGQQQVSENTRFCSRCGFLMTGTIQVVANNGEVPGQLAQHSVQLEDSPKKKGVKQGGFVMLSGLLIVPLLAIIHAALNAEPYLVAAAAIISFWGGILRIIYALIFQPGAPKQLPSTYFTQHSAQPGLIGNQSVNALPPQQSIPATDYAAPHAGSWRETNDLVSPTSVTDSTTKLLQKED